MPKIGYKVKDEVKKRISFSVKNLWKNGLKKATRPKGFKMSDEQKMKIGIANSIALKGHKLSKESIKKRTKSRNGYKHNQETKRKIGLANSISLKGKIPSIETRKKSSESHKGVKSYLWKGGITPMNLKIRNSLEMRLWREAVFKRDKFTCVWCGKVGGKLNADHIQKFSEYPELRFAIDNGRTLCLDCHSKRHKKEYMEKIAELTGIPVPNPADLENFIPN